MKNTIRLLAGLLLFCGALQAAEDAESYYNKAKEFDKNSDYQQAVVWHEKAAELDHVESQYILGISYYRGEGVEKDWVKSAYWYKRAAEQGHADAQDALGSMYEKGEGVAKNSDQAHFWYRKAAEQSQVNP
ncbi:tetratricopeptide repeat protein [Aliikangiella coralliicola]|uniref:Sel1 repeat family protein n=1 Tax=Aliikangiella coralliicola TaxID=2592383 RepID=A0A545U8H7_9GAMM|nr:tetratricopeptide repeat protein [Aliikangiella coralliicola]TQV85774.1 sel1 repeat family protein [Aliikangiella coralliicola]